jgi:hypothetical protein
MSIPFGEGGEPNVGAGGKFDLVVERPDLVDFECVTPVAFRTLPDGHKVPETYDILFPDGSATRSHRADEVLYRLNPIDIPHAIPIIVTLDRAAHVKHLHLDGGDSGSTFFEGTTLQQALQDVSEVLPETAISGNYEREAFTVDMGREYGWENLVDLWEALEQGLISQGSSHLMDTHYRDISRINREHTLEAKQHFVDYFNDKFKWSDIFLQVIREADGGVVIPHIYGEPHTTSSVMIALSTRRAKTKSERSVRFLHTLTPGRAMGKHPIPGQHMAGSGVTRRLDTKSFRSSSYNWTHHLLVVPRPIEQDDDTVE